MPLSTAIAESGDGNGGQRGTTNAVDVAGPAGVAAGGTYGPGGTASNVPTSAVDPTGAVAQASEVPKVSARHQQQLDALARESGPAFDAAYLGQTADGHGRLIQLFEDIDRRAGDPELKQCAREQIPAMKRHRERARALKASLATGNGAANSGEDTSTGGDSL